ncbi:NAD-reducing hydrogenase HoxS subunit alpha [Rhodovastum atsumiense]|uniref:NADH-quinone oxidoreductase subunit J n=1 Tax=Rhodovastum atsumiense TaxID=504468 RepID=A0A5M6IWD8_9PROT|nr:NAD(P)H-dependent oxidoreductase subunit E [Rhodovastum atsumiense]KAA5612602.1 NADH-quinone oxidoreductase subunit J [Rhodovastum atsumiense]CAH2601299.1 NAD-reducing hydrogenase HoxS subunit alpha [Rhodovastum atsumiense]
MLLTLQDKEKDLIADLAKKYIIERLQKRSALIPILQALQTECGYISEFAMQYIADLMGMSAAEVYGVATFYHFVNTRPKGRFIIRLSRDMSSMMKGAKMVAQQLQNDLGIRFGETTPDGMFTLEWTSCIGMNYQAPAMMVNNEVFSNLTAPKVHRIIEDCRQEYNAHRKPVGNVGETYSNTLNYANHQANAALTKVVAMSPREVIAELTASGLRGRGGAGFPTGLKWQFGAAAKGDPKYMVCNADEGEPGTFKDRIILGKHADMVFEGMTIAAYVVGAREGIVYLRYEYSHLRPHLEAVLEARRRANLLGKDILGRPGFCFDVRIHMGAGAYVCGEETALIESLEGRRGEPRNRPPYPVERGFNNCPTIVNNVETLASACCILDRGAKWFASMGTERSKGFKLFSVSGDCTHPGVYELPWGITVDQLLETVGGKGAKAVQVGGYTGQLVPARQFDRKIAYEDLGIGGSIIIYGPDRDMLEVAENYLEFFIEESCGQCTPCRDGNVKLLEGIRLLKRGTCSNRYLNDLIGLSETIKLTSKCGLGQASPNVIVALNAHFKEEILARPIQGH